MTEEPTITRTKFQAGADIPEWVIVAEPVIPNAIRGKFTFGCPVDLIDLPDYFLIVPCVYGPLPPVVNFSGAGCKIMASGKPVRVVNAMGTFQTEAVDAWGSMAGIVGQVQAPVQAPPAQTMGTVPAGGWYPGMPSAPEPRPSLWKRLFG